jgi:hypothetical protein
MRDLDARPAAEVVDLALRKKPELMIHSSDLPSTVESLRCLLSASEKFFERGMPVRLVTQVDGSAPSAVPVTKNIVVMQTHQLCQPMKAKPNGEIIPVTLPDRVALMYLDMVGEWHLRPRAGRRRAPLLSDDGGVRPFEGYDSETRLWCYCVSNLSLPARPSRAEAEAALHLLRSTFRTFPFADSARLSPPVGPELVDTAKGPGRDESAFLVAMLTACCRSSLPLAPGLLVTAPQISGAGSGKGLLVRAICAIAFGIQPRAFTPGHNRDELDKRLAAEFAQAQPVVFLDNANGLTLRSDTLASVLTERPATVRVLGETRMVPLNSTAFVAMTGNGVTLSEDLPRRFVVCEFDARCEDPESREFSAGFLEQVAHHRAELLAAVLTIWRWGRQNAETIAKGKPLGSFETWASWCRDPLLELGCTDPVERIDALKARDPRRLHAVEVFHTWWEHHGERRTAASQLAEPVRALIDPHNRGRQYLASQVGKLVGTNAGGYVLTRQGSDGKWTTSTYILTKFSASEVKEHRGHRGHRGPNPFADGLEARAPTDAAVVHPPMTPMTPMPNEIADEIVMPGEETAL